MIRVVWTFDTFQNNFEINHEFTKVLEESCQLDFDPHLSYRYLVKIAFVREISPK